MTNRMPAMSLPDSISATGFELGQVVSTLIGLALVRSGLGWVGRGVGQGRT